MNIELRHLRYFVAVAEEASFTAAAQRVHVAQQVLSTQIRKLEDAVGTRLLERSSRGVAVTPAGAAFLAAAREKAASPSASCRAMPSGRSRNMKCRSACSPNGSSIRCTPAG